MTDQNDPAHPLTNEHRPPHGDPGLTKREYFAALIMAAQYGNSDPCIIAMSPQQAATMAVEGANALIEALNKTV